jgi:hypothetical protein
MDDILDVTALCRPYLHRNPRAVKTLIDCRGDEVDAVDMIKSQGSSGGIPLHWAARHQLRTDAKNISTSALDKII